MKTSIVALIYVFAIAFAMFSCKDKSTNPEEWLTIENVSFSPANGLYNAGQLVSLQCPTQGVNIRYTTDGSAPTQENGFTYQNPFSIQQTCRVRARAYKKKMNPSGIKSGYYCIGQMTEGFESSSFTSLPWERFGAANWSISYTDSQSGQFSAQSGLIGGISSTTLQITMHLNTDGYISFWKSVIRKPNASLEFLIDGTRYGTWNGSDESYWTQSTYFVTSGTRTFTWCYSGLFANFEQSDGCAKIDDIIFPLNAVATPTFTPPGGTYNSTQAVSMSCSTPGATIKYTTNGSTPTSSSPQYQNPVTISATTTLKARAFRSGWYDSEIASAVYNIDSTPTVATPTFNPPGGSYSSPQSVTISCSTSGATIRYTTDGSNPTSSSPTYSNPISITSSTTIKAKAFKSGWNDSQVESASYNIQGPLLTEIGSYVWPPNNGASCVRVIGNYAYVGAGTRLRIMDVSNPSNITELGSCYVDGALDIKIANGYAYVVALTSGLKIVDISNPSNPFVVGSLDTPGYANGVDVVANRAYVCDEAHGLHIIDVSTPSAPSFIGNYNSPGFANRVTVSNGIAFLADWSGGIRIVNVNNSTNPYELSYIFPAAEARAVVYSNSVLYVGGPNMVCAINVANVSSPFELWSYSTEYNGTVYSVNDMDLNGNRLFIAASLAGIRLLDTSNSSSIQEIGYAQTISSTAGIDYSNGRLYVADSSGGLRIFQVNSRY